MTIMEKEPTARLSVENITRLEVTMTDIASPIIHLYGPGNYVCSICRDHDSAYYDHLLGLFTDQMQQRSDNEWVYEPQ